MHEVAFDRDGFMADPGAWTPEIAAAIARAHGLELMPQHWEVIEFCRRDAAARGDAPGVRRIVQHTGIPTRELYALFPKGPGILAARLAGLRKPKSCV